MQRYGYFTQPPNNMLKKYVLKHKNEVLLQKRGNLKPSIRIIRIKFLIFVAITKNVEMVSVSFDDYKSIFDETMEKDRIKTNKCFVETEGENSDLYQIYRLHKGFKNYLLDKDGVIIAKNIEAKELSSYLN